MSIQKYRRKEVVTLLKYVDYYITFQEVPNEVSLVLTVSGCPLRCPGCHSPWLWNNDGKPLLDDLHGLIERYYPEITCVCIMGTGSSQIVGGDDFQKIARIVREYKELKLCVYTGFDDFPDQYVIFPDYLKLGGYIADRGGLASPTTNQRMLKLVHGEYVDITPVFWKKKV